MTMVQDLRPGDLLLRRKDGLMLYDIVIAVSDPYDVHHASHVEPCTTCVKVRLLFRRTTTRDPVGSLVASNPELTDDIVAQLGMEVLQSVG